jgi:SAM-dependent methyltransferase
MIGGRIVGVDRRFVYAYLARHYWAPAADFVVADAEDALPFAAACFDRVMCHEALQYMQRKEAVVREWRRVATPDASFVVTHLPNRAMARGYVGIPCTLEECVSLNPDAIFDQSARLREWLATGRIEFIRPDAPEALQRAPAFALMWRRPKSSVEFRLSWVAAPPLGPNPVYAHRDGSFVAKPSIYRWTEFFPDLCRVPDREEERIERGFLLPRPHGSRGFATANGFVDERAGIC